MKTYFRLSHSFVAIQGSIVLFSSYFVLIKLEFLVAKRFNSAYKHEISHSAPVRAGLEGSLDSRFSFDAKTIIMHAWESKIYKAIKRCDDCDPG